MSNRKDPAVGRASENKATKKARQMTVYDRLEDARKRRQALLAERNSSAPTPVPAPQASNQPTPPKPAESEARTSEQAAPDPAPPAEPEQRRRRRPVGYWGGLFQAMAAVFVIAAIVAVFARGDAPSENPAAATALVQPTVTTEALPVTTPAASTKIEQTAVIAQSNAPIFPQELTEQPFDVAIAPLVQPIFPGSTLLAEPSAQDSLPTELDTIPAFERLVPPIVLTRVPPSRPVTEPPIEAASAIVPSESFAEETNVVLMVPSFAPQSEAENIVTIAARVGVPVDQTRRQAISIRNTNIRYYHDQDREPATLLADNLGGVARDFTNFTPPPNPGVIEIWMAGRSGPAQSNQGSATARGIEADLEALRNSIQRALDIAAGN